jgi:hypothetical protein
MLNNLSKLEVYKFKSGNFIINKKGDFITLYDEGIIINYKNSVDVVEITNEVFINFSGSSILKSIS